MKEAIKMKKNISQLTQWLKEHRLLLKLIFLGSVLVSGNQVTISPGKAWPWRIFSTMEQQKYGAFNWYGLGRTIRVIPMPFYDYVVVKLLEKKVSHQWKRMGLVNFGLNTNVRHYQLSSGFGGRGWGNATDYFLRKRCTGGARLQINGLKKLLCSWTSKAHLFYLCGVCWFFFIRTQCFFVNIGLVIIGSLIAPALWFHVFKTANIALKHFFPKAVLLLFGASLGQWLGGMFAFLMIGRLMQVPVSMVSVYPMFVIATLIGMLTMVPGWYGNVWCLNDFGLITIRDWSIT